MTKLADVALLFLRLGFTAFGGPAAHVAIMEDEVVRRRGWLSHEKFLDLLGATSLIPGPSSSELAIYIGYEQAGVPGLVVAGVCFILPAAVMTGLLAWAYVKFGSLPQLGGALHGIKPVVIAIVAQALWGLGPKAVKKSKLLGVLGVLACVATAFGVGAVVVLVATGIACALVRRATAAGEGARAAMIAPVGLTKLFLAFVKLGAVVFGSGYVLLAFLRADLVDRLHWLTESQLMDAVAVGQVTPGPVFTTATFLGYLLGGAPGALVATIGIFLPGFLLVGVTRPLVARIRGSRTASSFLDGVNVASLALMAVVTVQLARGSLVDVPTVLLAAASAVLLLRFKVSSTWLVLGGAVAGVALS